MLTFCRIGMGAMLSLVEYAERFELCRSLTKERFAPRPKERKKKR